MKRLIVTLGVIMVNVSAAAETWQKHIVFDGVHCNTAIAADFTGDGKVDVICSAGGVTRLLLAPDWREVELESASKLNFIHSELLDADGDGDLDYIGARYQPGQIAWLERPEKPLEQRWKLHLVDDRVNGIHGLLVGDVDGDGKPDLLANSAQPVGTEFPNSLVWYKPPGKPGARRWARHVFAKGDAPGLSHYLGVGDVNGDGRADGASAAKGGPQDKSGQGNWFAWWEAPQDPTQVWKKHLIADGQAGATNIHPVDVNGDGRTDFIASRGHGRGVIWFEHPESNGGKWREHEIAASLHGPHCLVVADIDGDGDPDAATCAKDDQVAAWFENDGRGKFTTHVVGRNQAAYDIRAVDMDADGDLDLLVAGQASRNVVWYANPLK